MEISQEAVSRAFKSLTGLSQEEHLKTWLIGIVLSEARAFLHDGKHISCDDVFMDDEADGFEYAARQATPWNPIPINEMKQNKTRNALSDAVQRLPQKCRVVLFLRDVLRLSTPEAARSLAYLTKRSGYGWRERDSNIVPTWNKAKCHVSASSVSKLTMKSFPGVHSAWARQDQPDRIGIYGLPCPERRSRE